MADNFGLKIGVEGEKEFKKELTYPTGRERLTGTRSKRQASSLPSSKPAVYNKVRNLMKA